MKSARVDASVSLDSRGETDRFPRSSWGRTPATGGGRSTCGGQYGLECSSSPRSESVQRRVVDWQPGAYLASNRDLRRRARVVRPRSLAGDDRRGLAFTRGSLTGRVSSFDAGAVRWRADDRRPRGCIEARTTRSDKLAGIFIGIAALTLALLRARLTQEWSTACGRHEQHGDRRGPDVRLQDARRGACSSSDVSSSIRRLRIRSGTRCPRVVRRGQFRSRKPGYSGDVISESLGRLLLRT
jgi:hypothetical protein